jgi:anti-sigma factor RsiW
MSCTALDLKAYLLGESPEADRRAAEAHLAACASCREELERLRLTEAALRSLPLEEIPRRIAFVSDRVFEPSWWRRLWRPAPGWALASAALVAAAILAHGWIQRETILVQSAPPDPAVVAAAVEREVDRRLGEAVARAVAAHSAVEADKTARLLRAVREEFEIRRREDRAQIEQAFEVLNKRLNVVHLASAYQGDRP